MSHTEFDTRMKTYENATKIFLLPQSPVIIRIDGRAFHTFTKGMKKPFDEILSYCMSKTAEYLLNNVANCVFAYTQSDEISLLLVDYQTKKTSPWFDNNQQKLVSLAAAMATLQFNCLFKEKVTTLLGETTDDDLEYLRTLTTKFDRAVFDARAFNIPKDEIVNYFIWRQQDATRNSIQMVAQHYFSQKRLHNKNTKVMQEMLMSEKGVNWNDTPVKFKRGIAIYKRPEMIKTEHEGQTIEVERAKSFIDNEMPILTQDRDFIKKYCPYAY